MLDIIIKNAEIIDGTGKNRYKGAIGCKNGKIVLLNETGEEKAALKIDAEGMIACPGFIDSIYATHLRNESYDILGAVQEAIEIARATGVKVQISHLKICGKQNWNLGDKVLELVEKAREAGIRITCDQYPYKASMTHLSVCIPPKYFSDGIKGMVELIKSPENRKVIRKEIEGGTERFDNMIQNCGGFDGIFISAAKQTPDAVGRTIGEYARDRGMNGYDALFDILIKNKGVATAMYFCMDESNIIKIIQKDYISLGTDGIVWALDNMTHPRAYAAFAHAICRYVKELPCVSMEKMICKMTGLPAFIYGLAGKGVIKDGADFDIVVFSEMKLKDEADYINPTKVCAGIQYVINGGKVIWRDREMTAEYPGKVLLKNAREEMG